MRPGFLMTFVRKNTGQRLTSQFLHFLIWYPQCRILAMVHTCGRFTSLVTLGQRKQDLITGSAIDKSIVVGEGWRVTCAEVRDRSDGTSFIRRANPSFTAIQPLAIGRICLTSMQLFITNTFYTFLDQVALQL